MKEATSHAFMVGNNRLCHKYQNNMNVIKGAEGGMIKYMPPKTEDDPKLAVWRPGSSDIRNTAPKD